MRLWTMVIGLWLAMAGGAWAQCAPPGDYPNRAGAMAQGLNGQRVATGLGGLAVNQELTNAAQRHACDVAATNRFGHTGSDGSAPDARVRQSGYSTCLTAENVAWGYSDPGQVVQGWMQSPGHRRNMLHPGVAEYGVGLAQGADGPVWVLVMARAC